METAWFFYSLIISSIVFHESLAVQGCPVFLIPFVANLDLRGSPPFWRIDMDSIETVKAYFAALDSANLAEVDQYLAEDYQLVDFTPQPMDKEAMLQLLQLFKSALPNLKHSLSNIRVEENVVKLTVQRSGTNTGHLDLRKMGIGVVPRTQKFIIFPNANYEFVVKGGKITKERDVSPVSPNRRLSGLLKALGVNMAAM
jgi:hypothetical protein